MESTKECSACSQLLPLSRFPTRKNAAGASIPRSTCKSCENEKSRRRRTGSKDYSTKIPAKVPRGKSLGVARPEIVKFIDPEERCDVFSLSYGSGYKVSLLCPYCGSRKKVRANSLSRKGYALCSRCAVDQDGNLISSGTSRMLVHNVPEARQWWVDDKDIDTVFAKSHYCAKWQCPECGEKFTKAVRYFTPKCECTPEITGTSLVVTHPDIARQFSSLNDFDVRALSYNSARNVWWECDQGHSWCCTVYQRVNSNTGCPHCSCNGTSNAERGVVDYVTSLVDNDEVVTNSRSIIAPKELDIYIPPRGIAIEFNGLYWHTESQGKDRQYHQDKWLSCREKGIQLVTVWEDQWRDHQEVVKSMLNTLLSESQGADVTHDGELLVERVPEDAAESFFEEYSLYEVHHSDVYIALRSTDGSLVAVSAWKKEGIEAVLSGFHTVVPLGDASRVLVDSGASWARLQGCKRVVINVQCDLDLSWLLVKHGFAEEGLIPPRKQVVVDGHRMPETLPGHDSPTIWDCGKMRYTLDV